MEKRNKKIVIIALVLVIFIGLSLAIFSKKAKNSKVRLNITTNSGAVTVKSENTSTGTEGTKVIDTTNYDEPLAFVNNYEGTVDVKGPTQDIRPSNGLTLEVNDTIITGEDGEVEIIFSDSSVIRLNHNTTLKFTKLDKENSQASLENGEIWARILKPIYDKSFFSIETSDLSAGVRGTSVVMVKNTSGTDVKVIDSYSKVKGDEGISVKLVNNLANRQKEFQLKPENKLLVKTDNTIPKIESFKTKDILNEDFILDNTKRDIIYMDVIKKKIRNNKDLKERIQGELAQSLPTKDEVQAFFKESIVREKVAKYISGGGIINPNAIIQDVKREGVILDARREIKDNRDNLRKIGDDLIKKKTIEEIIRQKEDFLKKTIEQIRNNIDIPIKEPAFTPIIQPRQIKQPVSVVPTKPVPAPVTISEPKPEPIKPAPLPPPPVPTIEPELIKPTPLPIMSDETQIK